MVGGSSEIGARKENRSKAYKAGINTDESRRRREETTVQLRRNKREDSLMKRRKDQTSHQSNDSAAGPMTEAAQHPTVQIPPAPNPANLHELHEMVQSVMSEDRTAQLGATTRFRKLLSLGATPPLTLSDAHKQPQQI